MQTRNGVVDIACADEAEATSIAKLYLSYFQGTLPDSEAADHNLLRHLVPENRLRVYAVREVVDALFDVRSVLELRRNFGRGMVTALARLEGRPLGVLANDPAVLGGAIDAEAADKAARFMRLCDAHGLPIVSLVDTPGFMVGPKEEENAQVRRACAMFLAGARVSAPFISIVLRKGYGLGAQATAAGSFSRAGGDPVVADRQFGGRGSRARCASDTARSSRRSRTPSAGRPLRGRGRAPLRNRQGDEHGRASRDRWRHRPGRDACR